MTYSIVWTKTAEEDLISIIEYISLQDYNNSINILNLIEKRTNNLSSFPERGRIVPELKLANISIYRELIISVWRIIYKILHNKVIIVGIFDSRRNLEDLLLIRITNF